MLELLKMFLVVVEKGTYTAAGEALGVTHSTVSRKMARLERLLKVNLIKAYPTGIVLTDEGQKLVVSATDLCGQSERMIADLLSAAPTQEGELKVLTETFGVEWLTDVSKEFEEAYPNIKLDIRRDDYKDLLYVGRTSGAFIGLTSLPKPKDTTFIWKKLGDCSTFPFAHPSYLEEHGTPQTFDDLDHHRLMRYRWAEEFSILEEKASNFLLYAGRSDEQGPRDHVFTTDDASCCRNFIAVGKGIGMIPRYQARNTNLVELFKDGSCIAKGHKATIHLVYPDYLRENGKIKAFSAFIQKKMKNGSVCWLNECD